MHFSLFAGLKIQGNELSNNLFLFIVAAELPNSGEEK